MPGELAPGVGRRVGVGVEVDDADPTRSPHIGDGRRAGPRDRVVAPEDDRNGARSGHLADFPEDHRVAAGWHGRDDVRVAGVDDAELLERPDVKLERVDRASRVLRLPDRARPEAGARTVGDHVVERRADDRDIGAVRRERLDTVDPRQVRERGLADVGRQIELAEDLVLTGPAIANGKVGRWS